MLVFGGLGGVGVGRRLLPESVLQGAPDGPCRLQLLGAQDRVFHRRQGNRCAATLQESGLTTHCFAMSFGPSGINSPPEGGEQTPLRPSFGGLRAALAASRPPPRAAPRRRGVPPPAPWAAPLWPPATAPAACLPAGRGQAQRAGRRPEGFRASGEIFKKVGRADARRGVPGGVPPGAVERWATRVRAVGGQGSTRSVVPAVHGPQRCPRRNGPLWTPLKILRKRVEKLF